MNQQGLALSLDPLAAVEEKLRFDPFKDSLKVTVAWWRRSQG
jgi:hypothetical protein